MNTPLIYAIGAFVIVIAVASYMVGAYMSIKDEDARAALASSYIEQELLREQIYLMRGAGAATPGAESSVAARLSRHSDTE